MKHLEQLKNDRRGMGLGDLPKVAIAFVFIAVVIGVGAEVVGDTRETYYTGAGCDANSQVNCSYNYNVTTEGLSGLSTMADWLPTIALVIAAAIVIGVLAMFRSG